MVGESDFTRAAPDAQDGAANPPVGLPMTRVEAPADEGWLQDDFNGGSGDEVDRRSVASASTIVCDDSVASENNNDDMAAVAAANRFHAASRGEGDA